MSAKFGAETERTWIVSPTVSAMSDSVRGRSLTYVRLLPTNRTLMPPVSSGPDEFPQATPVPTVSAATRPSLTVGDFKRFMRMPFELQEKGGGHNRSYALPREATD